MSPYVWSSWVAGISAAIPLAWMLSIELGTSRKASRQPDPNALELETRTGQLVDVGAGIAIIGGAVSSIWVDRLIIQPRLVTYGLGLMAMFGALALSGSARRHLGRFHRDNLTRHSDHELVDSGPYQFVRHPLYTATSCAFIGIGLCFGTWLSLGLAALPIAALVHRIRVEERLLDRALGVVYQRYAQQRPRLVPFIW